MIAQQFGSDGLQVGSLAYQFPRFEPTNVALSTDSDRSTPAALAPLLYSGTTGPSGIDAPLLAAANGTFDPAAAAGKIVVVTQLGRRRPRPLDRSGDRGGRQGPRLRHHRRRRPAAQGRRQLPQRHR